MQARGPTPKNRGRKAAENGLKIRPLPYHRVGEGLRPEFRHQPDEILVSNVFLERRIAARIGHLFPLQGVFFALKREREVSERLALVALLGQNKGPPSAPTRTGRRVRPFSE